MSRFVISVGPSLSAAPYLDRRDVAELPFTPRAHRRWTSANGTVHFAAWCREEVPRAWVTEGRLRASFGHGRPAGDTVDDAYALVDIDRDGRGSIERDPLGMHGLYISRCADRAGAVITIVGNRADLVAETRAEITGRPSVRSLRCAAWLAFAGYPMESTTGFDGVEVLAQDTRIRIRTDGRVDVVTQTPVWEHDPATPPTDPTVLADALATHIESALRQAIDESGLERPRIELDGGTDTRVLVAVASAAGLLPEFDLVTHQHTAVADRARDAVRLQRHVHRSAGRSSLRDAVEPTSATAVTVSDLFGEIYRTGRWSSHPGENETLSATIERFAAGNQLGNLRLVREDLAAELHATVTDDFRGPAARVRRPDDLHQCHDIRRRIPGRQAPLVEHQERQIYPFYSRTCLQQCFAAGGWARSRELVHRTLIERAGANERDMPLHESTQRKDPTPVDRLQSFVDGVAVDDANPAWTVIDRDRFRAAAATLSAAEENERSQILGAAAALVWHSRTELPSR